MKNKNKIACAIFFGLYAHCVLAQSQDKELDGLMRLIRSGGTSEAEVTYVRESILKEAATTLGAREGLKFRACAITKEIENRRALLDKKYRFSDLMMGKGVMPPVISEAKDSMALTEKALRVASLVYQIDEPARLVVFPPTWRDWLYVGLPIETCEPTSGKFIEDKISIQHRPRTPQEEKFFRDVLKVTYQQGVMLAQSIFDVNRARLDRSYVGMRRYFDLYQRGMVSAPIIVSATDVVNNDDPDVLIVGETLIRITQQATFVSKPDVWVPLGSDVQQTATPGPAKDGNTSKANLPKNESSLALNVGDEIVSQSSRATPPVVKAPKKWSIRTSDGFLSGLLSRWAQEDGWKVSWMGARDIRITKDGDINQPDFMSAITFLFTTLKSGGYPIQFKVVEHKNIEISATR